jgi:hypothetical protein
MLAYRGRTGMGVQELRVVVATDASVDTVEQASP